MDSNSLPGRMSLVFVNCVLAVVVCGHADARQDDDRALLQEDLRALVEGEGPPIGRSVGSPGHRHGAAYLRTHFRALGLRPAFTDDQGQPSFDQPLPGSGRLVATKARVVYTPDGTDDQGEPLSIDFDEITPHWSSGSGLVEAPGVFTGYAIPSGPAGYMSFVQRNDLSDRVAVALRLEPMTAEGQSRWTRQQATSSGWTPRAASIQKAIALVRRNARGVVLLTPPGVSDPDSAEIPPPPNARESSLEIPVVVLSARASEALMGVADPQGRSLDALRRLVDEEPVVFDLPGRLVVELELGEDGAGRQNIGAILEGKGDLAHELIVLTANYDGPASLPAADTNASGVAALLHCARMLARSYERELAEVDHARSILFLASDDGAREPVGVRAYFDQPVTDLEHHAMLMVIESIGRPQRETVLLLGEDRGEGLAEWMDTHLDRSFFEFTRFPDMGQRMLFSQTIDADRPVALRWSTGWSDEHETELDTPDALDVDSMLGIADLIAEVALEMALDPTRFALIGSARPDRPRSGVRLGLRPVFSTDDDGVRVAAVMDDLPAQEAGIQQGDVLIEWNGQPMPNFDALAEYLGSTNRGDSVEITLIRDGQTLKVRVAFPE